MHAVPQAFNSKLPVLGEPHLISCTGTFSVWAVKGALLGTCSGTFPASPDPAVAQGNLCYLL